MDDLALGPCLRFRIILYDLNGKEIIKLGTKKILKIYDRITHNEWSSAYLKVSYFDAIDISNEGIYTTEDAFRMALKAFTEMELVDYAWGFV